MNKNIKRMFFVLTLVTLIATVGVVCAADDANSTVVTDNSVSEVATVSDATGDTVAAEQVTTTSNDNKVDTKTIEKKEKNLKTQTKTVDVNDGNSLLNTLTEAQSDNENDKYLINLNEGNYDLTSYTSNILIKRGNNGTVQSIEINGNNNTLKTTKNLNIQSTVIINDLNIYCNRISVTAKNSLTIYNTDINPNIYNTINGEFNIHNSTIHYDIMTNGNGITTIYDDCTYISGEFTGNGQLINSSYKGTNEIINENITKNITIPETGNITFTGCNITARITNNGNVSFIDCSFSNNNKANLQIYNGYLLYNNATATLKNCIIENNTFYTESPNTSNLVLNGAIVNNGKMTVINSSAKNNKLGYYNVTGSYFQGIAIGRGSVIANKGTLNIESSNLTDNYASESGGAIYNEGNLTVNNSLFENNTSNLYGGAIGSNYLTTTNPNGRFDAQMELTDTKFTNNKVILPLNVLDLTGGGAINIKNTNTNIKNCIFDNNQATTPIIGIVGVSADGSAIAIQQVQNVNTNATVNITNSTFTNHKSDVIHNGKEYYHGLNGTVINCTFENNNATTIFDIENLNITNNIFQDNTNGESVITNYIGYYGAQKTIENNQFLNNNITIDTINTYISAIYHNYTILNITTTNNTYVNTTVNDTLNLVLPNKIYTGEPITITGTYTINTLDNYDSNMLEQNKFNIYINGELNQIVDKLEFTVTPTAGTMMVTVQPTISQTRKTQAIRATTLTDITITPENYNEYIYEGVLVGVSKDTKVKFNGEFTNKDEIVFDTSDIIIDGSNATFTNTRFVLDADNIIFTNMIINDTETQYPIKNHGNNNIISNNTITLTNTEIYGAAIYNGAGNTQISNNTLNVEAPASDIDFSSGQGVASTQAILLLGGDKNTVQNNNINIKATSTSFYGTLEAITNNNEATNTLITQNTINISGANFNYAIDSLNSVENITITENNINVTGERYCDGIQTGNGATNILIDNNNITCVCINTTELDTEGAITYGVIATSMGSEESENITITNNNIEITGTANYGIELYKVKNTQIDNNNITVNGPFSMGIGYAYSPNGNATGNNITINGDSTTPINMITEEFKPENVGIRIQNGTTNVSITDNKITTSDVGGQDTTIHTDPDNVTIANNKLTSSNGYGDDTINAPETANIENNTIETNVTNIEYPDYVLTNTPITLTATVSDEFNNPLNSGSVIFSWDETTETAQVTNGTATITTIFTSEGDVTIHARYIPTTTGLTESVMGVSFKIEEPTTKVDIDNVTLTAGETVTLTAKVTDQAGNNITGGKVTFKVNGKTVKDVNGKVIYAKVIDGVATVEYNVPEGLAGKDVNITASYSGSAKYNKESTTITKTVVAQEPTLTITPITDNIQTGSTITLKAKVAAGDKAITTGKIVFKINGKTVKDANGKVIYAKVDANGEVSVDYNLGNLKAGSYTIEATFIAPNYDKITSNTSMTVVKT